MPQRVKSRRFVDSVTVEVVAGKGGDGCVSFRREKFVPRGGPDGGDGGRGGHIFLEADHNVDSLVAIYFSPLLRAKHGEHGRGQRQTGRTGEDLIAKVPCGTEIHDLETDLCLGELLEHGARLKVAEGGRGGLGNCHWKTSTHQAPREHTEGDLGETKRLRLDLKVIADIALVGFPNAGKSTLLSKISEARPRVAAYPFTTLNPIVGIVKCAELYQELRLVDIPGLIQGAHAGIGLGHTFLRHIERTRALLIVLDMAGTEGRSPLEDYHCLLEELKLYDSEILTRPRLIVGNKMDLPEFAENLKDFRREVSEPVLSVSAERGDGLGGLKSALWKLLEDL